VRLQVRIGVSSGKRALSVSKGRKPPFLENPHKHVHIINEGVEKSNILQTNTLMTYNFNSTVDKL
jgi:hypothetical protein